MPLVNEGIKMKLLYCVIYYIVLGVFSFLEFIHVLLSILGFGAVFIVGGAWGWIISIVYFLAGNLPYIIIQRYNRPRLLRLEDGMKKQEGLRQK